MRGRIQESLTRGSDQDPAFHFVRSALAVVSSLTVRERERGLLCAGCGSRPRHRSPLLHGWRELQRPIAIVCANPPGNSEGCP